MAMAPRKFRSEKAVKAYQMCLECSTLPANKKGEVEKALSQAQQRLQQQEEEVPYISFVVYFLLFPLHYLTYRLRCRI